MKNLQKMGSALVVLLLVLSIFAVYQRVRAFGFVDFDDSLYVRDNPLVASGLSLEGMKWAFSLEPSKSEGTYYHPLAWVSHMADVEMFGMSPGRHHLVNISFHLGNTLLLFLLLWAMTGAYWKSLLAAAMFGLHPVNVESVAWIAERKNLLSTFFWLLTMFSYWFYTRKPGFGRYALALFLFALGLLSKPMLATLPFVLLFMDYWPLKRFATDETRPVPVQRGTLKKRAALLVAEKAPFLVLALLSIGGAVWSLGGHAEVSHASAGLRLAQAAVLPVIYLAKLILPLGLGVYHAYPTSVPLWHAAAAGLLSAGACGLAFLLRKKHPYILVGLLWFLVTLVPVLGIIQGGRWPAYAERWAYVPFMGLFILIAWGMPVLVEKLGGSRHFSAAAFVTLLAFWAGLSWIQVGYWQDSLILFSRAVEVDRNNSFLENNLASAYKELGFLNQAVVHFRKAVAIDPQSAEAHINLAGAYALMGRKAEAERHIRSALALTSNNARVYAAMGCAYDSLGQGGKALACYARAVEIRPSLAEAHFNMGAGYARMDRAPEALVAFERAVEARPAYAEAHAALGDTLARLRCPDDAARSYREALKIKPGLLSAKVGLQRLEAEGMKEASPGK